MPNPSLESRPSEAGQHKLIRLSLAVNVLVLVPVCVGLVLGAGGSEWISGASSPARGILLAIYLAILAALAVLLVRPEPFFVAPLLFVQIVYKVLTPFTAGTMLNPAVASNLVISCIHAATLTAIWQHWNAAGRHALRDDA